MRRFATISALALLTLSVACPDQRRGAGDDDDAGGDDDDGADDDDDGAPDDDDGAPDDDDAVEQPCTAPARMTNVGCTFWAVDLDNAENFVDDAAAAQFAVAVVNVSDEVATVVVRINTAGVGLPVSQQLVESADVDPGAIHIFRLPRRDVDGDNVTDGTDDGPQTWHSSRAFKVVSTAPIVAYQFNTLDQQFSNDASLLLPDRALARDHLVLSYPPGAPMGFEFVPGFDPPRNRSYVTIVGTVDGTEVTVEAGVDFASGTGVSPINPGGTGIDGRIGIAQGTERTFVLNRYDVLNLETMLAMSFDEMFTIGAPDPSGTRVTSDEAVAVFTGTDLTAVVSPNAGEDGCCAEHFEQQILPTRVMRPDFVVSRSAVRNQASPENDMYRIMALQDGTTVTTSLGGDDASFTLDSGEFHELFTTRGFVVEGSGPLHVGQFLVQGTEAGSIGDTSLLYVPAVEQRQAAYTLTTGEGFSENWIVISAVEGTEPKVDGQDMAAASCDGPVTDGVYEGQTYVSWTCPVSDGAHDVYSGTSVTDLEGPPIATFVYGYYSAGSYAYPGGSGLD